MPAAKNVNIHVEGNFTGNIIIGNNNVVQTPHGVQVNKTKTQPKFERRTKPINLRPRSFTGLLGRTDELQTLQNAISKNISVTLFGENGIGKTSILRQTAHDTVTKQFEDGVIYLSANGEERDDLLQQLFDAIYAGSPNHKPTEAQIRSDLKNIHALIILDDIALKREEITTLLDAMPKSVFILASDERALWGEGQAIGLDGLPQNESLQLFQRELGRNLNEDEKPVAIQICKILLFHPLRILQTASLIREDGISIQQAFTSLTATKTKSAPLEVTLQKSNETQKKILSLLAVAGGFVLTREHVQQLAGAQNFDLDIKPLLGRGLVEVQGANFSLSPEAVTSLVRLWDLSGWEDRLINHFSTWLQSAPQDMLVDQTASTLFYLIQRAGEKKQWENVIIIGKRLEQFYASKKKWAGWLKILKLIHIAAQYLKDQYLQGWALHQLGSRAMCLDLKVEAQDFLTQALEIRKGLGDKAAISVTQNNLNVLTGLPPTANPVKPRMGNLQKLILVGGAGGGVAVILLLAIIVGSNIFTPLPPTETPSPTHTIIPTKTLTNIPTTSTSILTLMPTGTSTLVPRPVILFDFVENANKAIWTITTSLDSFEENVSVVKFLEAPATGIFPQTYAAFSGEYVGWTTDALLEDQSSDSLVLLTFPHHSEAKLSGIYDLQQFTLQTGDVLEIKVGRAVTFNEFPSQTNSVRFVVKFYDFEPDLFPKSFVEITAHEDFYDGKTYNLKVAIPSSLYGKNGWFVLEVYSGENSSDDFAVWMNAILFGVPR